MYQFIETIQILNGEIQRLEYHQKRMDETRRHFYDHITPVSLGEIICPPPVKEEIKCRIVYDRKLADIQYSPYNMRHIRSLKLVEENDIDYPFKSTDRSVLAEIALQRGECDEVLIVRNGLITDTSYTNVALYDGKDWFTPTHPLLKGTQRESLIQKGLLHEQDIHVEDLSKFQYISPINAMINLNRITIPISCVY